MSARVRSSLSLLLAAALAALLFAPRAASAASHLPKRYDLNVSFALDASGTAAVDETSTSYFDSDPNGHQTRTWTFPRATFPNIEVLGVFYANGVAYRRANTANGSGTYRAEVDTSGVRISAWDSSITDRSYVLRYRLPFVVKRYFNAALFATWVIGAYDASVLGSATITPPSTLSANSVRASQWGPSGGKLVVAPDGVLRYHNAKVPAGKSVWVRVVYPPSEFAGVPLTIGDLGLVSSPSKSSATFRRSKGSAVFSLGVKVTDCVGDPLGGARVYLQTSANGRSWRNAYSLKTNAKGSASRRIRVTKAGTTYYRWSAPARANAYHAATTSKQAIRVK